MINETKHTFKISEAFDEDLEYPERIITGIVVPRKSLGFQDYWNLIFHGVIRGEVTREFYDGDVNDYFKFDTYRGH